MDKQEQLALIDRRFGRGVPHNRALGLRAIDVFDRGFVSELPYAAHLVGNPTTGALAGGAVTALIDASSGMAVFLSMTTPSRIATLDLRIDYLGPSVPGAAVRCRAECYKVTRRIAFTRATAYCGEPDRPIATSAGTFMIFDKRAGSINPRAPEGTQRAATPGDEARDNDAPGSDAPDNDAPGSDAPGSDAPGHEDRP